MRLGLLKHFRYRNRWSFHAVRQRRTEKANLGVGDKCPFVQSVTEGEVFSLTKIQTLLINQMCCHRAYSVL